MQAFSPFRGWLYLSVMGVLSGFAGEPPETCPPSIQWQQTFGGEAIDYLYSLRTTADNGCVLAGMSVSMTGDRVGPHYGGADAWVIRFDAARSILWERSFGGNKADRGTSILQTADGGFILGATSDSAMGGNKTSAGFGLADYWVVRLDATGAKIWDQSYGGNGDDGLRIAVETSDGGFLLGGSSSSAPSGNKTSPWHGATPGSFDIWIVKIDATGAKLWEQSYGGSQSDYLGWLVQTGDGGFLLAGYSDSPADGTKTTESFGGSDFWVIRVNAAGETLWQRSYGGTSWDYLGALTQTPDGGFLIGGLSHSGADGNKTSPSRGGGDYWIVRLDDKGDKVWENSFGGTSYDNLKALHLTEDGGFLLGGSSASLPDENKTSLLHGYSDYWLLRVSDTGQKIWEQSFGGINDDIASTLATRTNGSVIIGGWSFSPPRDNKTAPQLGEADFWLLELVPQTPGDCDSDGVPDAADDCPGTVPGSLVNSNGCSVAQFCPCDSNWLSSSNYVSCVRDTTAEFVSSGLLTEPQRAALILAAEGADCPPTPITTVYFGLTNAVLGDAILSSESPYDSQLKITDVGATGTDGVSVRLGRAASAAFISPYADIWGNFDPAWFMRGSAVGRVNGVDRQPITFVRGRKPDYEVYPIDFDLGPLGPTSLTFQVLLNDTIVSEATEPGATGTVTVHTAATLGPRVNAFWRMPDGSVGVLVELTERIDGALPEFHFDGPFDSARGDRLFVRANQPTNQVEFVSQVDVRVGGGLREFIFLDERPVAFGRAHRSLGPVIFEPDLARFGVRLDEVGSGSGDPAAGVLMEMRDEVRLDLGLEPLALTDTNPIAVFRLNGVDTDVGDTVASVQLNRITNVITGFALLAGSSESEIAVQVYREGVLQAALAATNGSMFGTFLIQDTNTPPRILGVGGAAARTTNSRSVMSFSFDRIVAFRGAGGEESSGDHFRLLGASNGPPTVLNSFALMVTGAPGFAILSETASAEVPRLEIQRVEAGIELSWQGGNVPVGLEASDQLPGSFASVSADRTYEGGVWRVLLPDSEIQSRFFRLRRAVE